MSAHTPGPWTIKDVSYGQDIMAGPIEVAHVRRAGGAPHHGNSRLVAAAPDLLEALQMALTELDGLNLDAIGFDRTALATMREAVAKAVKP